MRDAMFCICIRTRKERLHLGIYVRQQFIGQQQPFFLAGVDPNILATLARAYFATGEVAKAVEVQQEAVDLAPDDVAMTAALTEYKAALANP